jgi:hypothetical protein
VAEILEHDAIEILGVVDGYLLWNSIATDDVLLKEFLDVGERYVGSRLHFNPFGEVFHCNDDKSVVSLCWCKFTNDVNALPLQGPRWGNQLRRLCGSIGAMRDLLTSFAA